MAKRKWSGQAKRAVKKYNTYVKKLEERKRFIRLRGYEPYSKLLPSGKLTSDKLTYKQWRTIYTEELNDRKKEIAEGERKSIGDINAKIISGQVYELSEAQAKSIFDYLRGLPEKEKEKIDFSYKDINEAMLKIRQGDFIREDLGLWDAIRSRREQLFKMSKEEKENFLKNFKEGTTFKEAVRLEVSQTFFKSP